MPECALIAGLPQAPGGYNPFTNPDHAKQRQSIVLRLMGKQGFITHDQRASAESTPLSYNPAPYPIEALTNFIATDATPIERRKSITVLNLPVETQTWAHTQGLPLISDYSQALDNTSQQENQLVLLSPHPNTIYRTDSNFNLSAQQIQIEVAVRQGVSSITIWAEGVNAMGEIVKSDVVTINVVTK